MIFKITKKNLSKHYLSIVMLHIIDTQNSIQLSSFESTWWEIIEYFYEKYGTYLSE
jgi:hypothetical protein